MYRNSLSELSAKLSVIDCVDDMAYAASKFLGETLNVSRVGYGTVNKPAETIHIERDWNAPGVKTLAGTLRFRDYGSYIDDLKRGVLVVFSDADKDERTASTARALKAISAQSVVNMPVSERGDLVALLYLNHAVAREWTDEELRLIREVAELTHVAIERRRAEHDLRNSEAKFVAIANSIDQMIWSTRPDGFHDYYNDRWYDYTGVPHGSTDGEAWNGMFHADDQERAWSVWRHCLDTGERYHIEYRLRHHSGEYRWVIGRAQCVRDNAGNITRWYGTCTDIHDLKMAEERLRELNATLETRVQAAIEERRMAEEALRQAQKMEAVGQLTGGIAHDFNNLLQIIIGNLGSLQRWLPAELGREQRAVNNAMSGAKRAATLTQRLLAFSRRQPLDPRPLNGGTLVIGMAEMLARALGETIALETVQGAGLWNIEADPNQLESAVLNLAVNARDAMPGGGKLTIETSNALLDAAYVVEHAEIPAGQYVVISVSDTGTGIDKAIIDKVFEPFFTTKEIGKGTGLGLSMVYGFVKQSGGHIKVYSEPGHGTTVKIYLPRWRGIVSDEAHTDAGATPQGSCNESILVVEDDPDVRAYTVEALRDLGYNVIAASDGLAGLAALEEHRDRISLLFTDVVMPGDLNGPQLAARASALCPSLKILFTTGYARNAIVHHGRLDAGVALITKPFTLTDLARRVREILEASA